MSTTIAILDRLMSLQDTGYKAFHSRLMPTVDPDRLIGVRTPAIRALAKELQGTPEAEAFVTALPHRYYEENNLHGCLIDKLTHTKTLIAALDAFLPYVDNWATCDMLSPKAFRRHEPEQLAAIHRWLDDAHPYTIRFGIKMLMDFYLEDDFDAAYPKRIAAIRSEEYYVRMMVAWYFATALAKQYDAVLPYLQQRRLEPWVHNKTIQKALESYRITPEQKAYLRTLKQKI